MTEKEMRDILACEMECRGESFKAQNIIAAQYGSLTEDTPAIRAVLAAMAQVRLNTIESCAKVAESHRPPDPRKGFDPGAYEIIQSEANGERVAAVEIAKAIRSISNKGGEMTDEVKFCLLLLPVVWFFALRLTKDEDGIVNNALVAAVFAVMANSILYSTIIALEVAWHRHF